jgi:glycosyltransferase involved in cell wall biosynthesis
LDRPLKILFLSNRGLLPVKDGHTRRSFNVLRRLAQGHRVYFLSLFETPEEIDATHIRELESFCEGVEFHPAPSKTPSVPMLARLFRSLLSFDPYTLWRHYSKPYMKRVDQLIASGAFDIVHCDILPLAYTIRRRTEVFRSLTDHDVSYLKSLRMGRESRTLLMKMFLLFESLKVKRLERRIFAQVNLGIAVSEVDKERLQELCPGGRFAVVENGVELETFKPDGSEVQPNTLLWVGGFGHPPNREGVSYFLSNIYPMVKREMPEVRLDLVGGGVPESLKKLTRADRSINVLGFVDDPVPYLRRSCVFVAPILSGGGTRLKLLEAMAMGKAAVTTRMGCEGIDGRNGIHFVVADAPRDFADGIVTLLQDAALRDRIGKNARELVERKYDWKIVMDKLNTLYREASGPTPEVRFSPGKPG